MALPALLSLQHHWLFLKMLCLFATSVAFSDWKCFVYLQLQWEFQEMPCLWFVTVTGAISENALSACSINGCFSKCRVCFSVCNISGSFWKCLICLQHQWEFLNLLCQSTHVVTIKTNAKRFVQTAKSAVLIFVVDVVVSVGLISFLSSCRIWNINYSEH